MSSINPIGRCHVPQLENPYRNISATFPTDLDFPSLRIHHNFKNERTRLIPQIRTSLRFHRMAFQEAHTASWFIKRFVGPRSTRPMTAATNCTSGCSGRYHDLNRNWAVAAAAARSQVANVSANCSVVVPNTCKPRKSRCRNARNRSVTRSIVVCTQVTRASLSAPRCVGPSTSTHRYEAESSRQNRCARRDRRAAIDKICHFRPNPFYFDNFSGFDNFSNFSLGSENLAHPPTT